MQVRDDCNKVSDTIRSIVRHSGIKSLARGLGITVCREVPAFGLYFSSYEILVRQKKNYTAWVFTSGGLAGIISWVFTYPIDVVKTKLQADTFGASSKYRNAFQCLKASMNSDGFKVLYRGMGSTVIR
jgi:solute carrier family 25 carnitine/acylcarnitine transporter 20/29